MGHLRHPGSHPPGVSSLHSLHLYKMLLQREETEEEKETRPADQSQRCEWLHYHCTGEMSLTYSV